jgi:uncharacterized protein YdeI (YjbR/CyaY-like superfamily)
MSSISRLALVALIAVAPTAGAKDASTAAMDACMQAFLSSDLAQNRNVVLQKKPDSVPRPLALSGNYTIELVAKGRETGKQLARVVCHADRNGQIVAVNGRPSSAVQALAAR